jgi:hypothetical protein
MALFDSNYKWSKEYKKLGYSVFDSATISTLKKLREKLSKDYLTFISEVQKRVAGTKQEQKVAALKSKIKQAVRLLGITLGSEGLRATKEQLSSLFSLMTSIDSELSLLSMASSESTEVNQAVLQAQASTKVSLQNIQEAHKRSSKWMKSIKPSESARGVMSSAFSKAGKGALEGVVYGALGYKTGALVGSIFSGSRGLFGQIREKRGARAQAELNEALVPLGTSERTYKGEEVSSLWSFFNKTAYRAEWTKELLHYIKYGRKVPYSAGESKSPTGKSESGGIVDKVTDVLAGAGLVGLTGGGGGAKFLGKATLVGGAALIGWYLGKYLDEQYHFSDKIADALTPISTLFMDKRERNDWKDIIWNADEKKLAKKTGWLADLIKDCFDWIDWGATGEQARINEAEYLAESETLERDYRNLMRSKNNAVHATFMKEAYSGLYHPSYGIDPEEVLIRAQGIETSAQKAFTEAISEELKKIGSNEGSAAVVDEISKMREDIKNAFGGARFNGSTGSSAADISPPWAWTVPPTEISRMSINSSDIWGLH